MRYISAAMAVMRRLLRPPRIVAVSRQPVGWFAVSRRGLQDVLGWGRYDNGQVVGLVADRRGLRPAIGDYLPAAPHNASDVQRAVPTDAGAVGDLEEAIRDVADPFSPDGLDVIYGRLKAAAATEWAHQAFAEFCRDPLRFLRNHFALIAEHGHRADLDDDWRDALARITEHAAPAAKEHHA